MEQLYGLGTWQSPGTIPALVSSWAVRGARLRAVRYVAAESLSCIRLFCNPMDCIVHQASLSMGFLQATILEWVAISFSRVSSGTQGSNPHLPLERWFLYR